MIKMYAAPMQGHTDAARRRFHRQVYGDCCEYCTPFIRLEKGDVRPRDLRDYSLSLNDGVHTEAQVIFRDMAELRQLLNALSDAGATAVNLNMGCPFVLQTSRGRGAALLARPEALDGLGDVLAAYSEMSFSVKMRAGYDDATQWRNVMPLLERLPLSYVAMHPRTAKQQYGGELHIEQFEAFQGETGLPAVFNGELHTPVDIDEICSRFPAIAGVMAGRGLAGRPSLFAEYMKGIEFAHEERIGLLMRFHSLLYEHYSNVMCGDAQILAKIKPFWEYAEEEIGRKAFKAIKKAGSRAKYTNAVSMIC